MKVSSTVLYGRGRWQHLSRPLLKPFSKRDDQVLICTHATFGFAVDKFGVEMRLRSPDCG
ncbi:hypothetical protein B9T16_21870 [Arthrospira sp. PCC 8006]|uniref:hypothetical protein n=1 Tax=Oscillatoriales TaxID=1150 RepID=UPI00396E80DA